MGRSRTITNEQILEAAREVFLAEGFGASTLDIAKRAGVSEGSIFKRFSTKENLFFSAMMMTEVPAWVESLNELTGKGNLQENVRSLSCQISEFLIQMLPRLVMLQAKGGPIPLPPLYPVSDIPPHLAKMPPMNSPLVRDVKALATFFGEEMRIGRLRPCDPYVVANMLMGALMNNILFRQMLEPLQSQTHDADYAIRVADFIWESIAPSSSSNTSLPE